AHLCGVELIIVASTVRPKQMESAIGRCGETAVVSAERPTSGTPPVRAHSWTGRFCRDFLRFSKRLAIAGESRQHVPTVACRVRAAIMPRYGENAFAVDGNAESAGLTRCRGGQSFWDVNGIRPQVAAIVRSHDERSPIPLATYREYARSLRTVR